MASEPQPAALMLAPEVPYPLAGGGALRTASILHYLAQHYAVDLIVFRQPGAPPPDAALPAGLVRHLTVLDLPRNSRSIAARALRNAGRVAREIPPLVDRFSGFDWQIAETLQGRHYDLGMVEHFWCAPYLSVIGPCCRRTVIDLHNIESVLHGRCSKAEGAAGLAHRLFEQASLELERTWLPRFSTVLATSSTDAETVSRIAPSARVQVYPNALPWTPRPTRLDEEAMVFSGNMEYHPNLQAVQYFHAAIWPTLAARQPGLVWRLVGKHAEALAPLFGGNPRIEIYGAVPDAVLELARARVAVVPLLAGSGTRLKILEAWAAGLPVVSTTMGAEGLGAVPGVHLLLADTPAAFADAVLRLLTCKDLRDQLGMAGRLLLEKQFTWETVWQNLDF